MLNKKPYYDSNGHELRGGDNYEALEIQTDNQDQSSSATKQLRPKTRSKIQNHIKVSPRDPRVVARLREENAERSSLVTV